MASTIAKTPTGIRKLNTKVWNDNGHFMVQLYATVVYDETADKIVLKNGGWVTTTTTSRINQALAHRGFSNRVGIRKGEMVLWCTRSFVPFQNGELILERQTMEVK